MGLQDWGFTLFLSFCQPQSTTRPSSKYSEMCSPISVSISGFLSLAFLPRDGPLWLTGWSGGVSILLQMEQMSWIH